MVIKERLAFALDESGKTQADVARDCNVSTAAVALWFSPRAKDIINIKHENIVKLAPSLGVSVEWLTNTYTNPSSKRARTSQNTSALMQVADKVAGYIGQEVEYVSIQSHEYWRAEVTAEIRFMSVPVQVLEEKGLLHSDVKSMQMPDDSQAGRILKGDMIAVSVVWGPEFAEDELYAIKIGGRYTLRRAMNAINGDLLLRCRNSDSYPDMVVAKDKKKDLDVLGKFVGMFGSSG